MGSPLGALDACGRGLVGALRMNGKEAHCMQILLCEFAMIVLLH